MENYRSDLMAGIRIAVEQATATKGRSGDRSTNANSQSICHNRPCLRAILLPRFQVSSCKRRG